MIRYHKVLLSILFIAGLFSDAYANFEIQTLSDRSKRQIRENSLWDPSCPLPLERLRLLKISYYDFEGKEQHNGQIVVMDAAAAYMIEIFKELHAKQFPIAKIKLIEHYQGNDEFSMFDNNTSGYNCRCSQNNKTDSLHAYGLAIDINPIQNPYVAFDVKGGHPHTQIFPSNGKPYLRRKNLKPGMAEPVVDIFKRNGFTIWGGKKTPVNWQHFEVPRGLAELLAKMDPKDAMECFKIYVEVNHKQIEAIKTWDQKFLSLYQKNARVFMETIRNNPKIFQLKSKGASDLLYREMDRVLAY